MKKILVIGLLLLVLTTACNNQFFTDRKFKSCFEKCIEAEGCELSIETPDGILCSGDTKTDVVGYECHTKCLGE